MPSDVATEAHYLKQFISDGVVFSPLVASDFFLPLHQLMFRAASGHDGVASRSEFLEDLGKLCSVTPGIENAVDDIMDPERLPTLSVEEMGEIILEKSRARKLIGWLGLIQTDLKLGTLTTKETKEKLAKWVART